MGIVEHSESVRGNIEDPIQCSLERIRGLKRQSVNQVQIDAVNAAFAQAVKGPAGQFLRLQSIYSFLHFWVKILHAHARAIEAHIPQRVQMSFGHAPGVDFHADFSILIKLKMLPDGVK